MPKPLSRKYVTDDYDSDNGFVEDAPKSKKQKREPKQVNPSMQKDDEGNEFWELSGKRRVQVSEFKGNTMLAIREYYESNGKMLPGKKGITMTVEQYTTFLNLIPDIERVLKKKGIVVPRPPFDSHGKVQDEMEESEDANADEDVEEEDEEEEEQTAKRKSKSKLDKFKLKKNHEATSDEDED